MRIRMLTLVAGPSLLAVLIATAQPPGGGPPGNDPCGGPLLAVPMVDLPGGPPDGPPGPGGPGGQGGRGQGSWRPRNGPQLGQILPRSAQDQLNLTDEQKKELAELQKLVDAKLDKLQADRGLKRSNFQEMQWRQGPGGRGRMGQGGRGGPGGPGSNGGPGGGPGGQGGPGGPGKVAVPVADRAATVAPAAVRAVRCGDRWPRSRVMDGEYAPIRSAVICN